MDPLHMTGGILRIVAYVDKVKSEQMQQWEVFIATRYWIPDNI